MSIINKWGKYWLPDNKSNSDKRILYYDVIKIIAAFLVVFYHYAFYRLDYGFIPEKIYYPNANRIIMCFASCCVPLFFLVNGSLMFSKHKRVKKVYLKIIKIGCLIIVWSYVGFPSWFFKTLMILYALFPFFQYCWEKKRHVYYAICILVFVMPFLFNFGVLGLRLIGVRRLHITGVFTMYSILYFLLGPILNQITMKPTRIITLIITGWAMVILECVIYTNIDNSMYDGVNAAFPTLGALMLSCGVFLNVKYFNWKRFEHIIVWLGNSILPVYLLHMAFINFLISFAETMKLNICSALLGSLIIFLVCTLVGNFMKRLPVVCWSVKI